MCLEWFIVEASGALKWNENTLVKYVMTEVAESVKDRMYNGEPLPLSEQSKRQTNPR